ncbi:MAG: TIGR01440 family protein [Clostridia bacterium]|nr:TIGR01440 family protein [Clostridia bacterium]
MNENEIREQVKEAFGILMNAAKPEKGALIVLGCSTSEICGKRIGSGSSEEAAKAVLDALLPLVEEAGLDLAVQGCEHINRSLCCSRATMKKYGLQQVWVKPWLHAGGACVTGAYERIGDAVMVENLNGQATLGIDIGDTLIGMHLHCVAVPVHSPLRHIGEANLVMAFSRPKYVGGPRAQYDNVPVGSDAHTQRKVSE